MAKIVVTEQIDPVGVALLRSAGHEVTELDRKGGAAVEPADVRDADALLVRIVEVTRELIESCPDLKIISKHGVGVDNIDLEAARERGVAVTITPGANSTSVAEHAFALLLALAKNLPEVCGKYREIGFAAKNCAPGVEITGKTLGVIGCGRIGSRVARMAHGGFGMRVLAYDPYVTGAPEGVELVADRDRVFAESDFVTLHPVLNKETEGCVGARELALMKPGAILINCGRGPLVDEGALIEALQSGRLGGAGLDVTVREPCPPDSPLFRMPNVLLTPHYAPTTREAAVAVSRLAAQNVVDFFENRPVEGLL